MIALVTRQEMQAAEERFVRDGGDLASIMAKVGTEVAKRIPSGLLTLVLAGPGNNGGDALAVAAALEARGDAVHVYLYKRQGQEPLEGWFESESDSRLDILKQELGQAGVVVDGLLGIGRKRPVAGDLEEIITLANNTSRVLKLSIDVPTGVDPDTGDVETVAFKAHITLAIGYGKRGLWGSPGRDYAGDIEIVTAGLGAGNPEALRCRLVTAEDICSALPRRTHDWNKGRSGTVLVAAGSHDFSGAAVLASVGAYRAGAGLVQVAVPNSIQATVATHSVESIFARVSGSDRWFSPDSLPEIRNSLEKADAFAIGPGLGQQEQTVDFVRGFLEAVRERDMPGVLDADGLNIAAKWKDWWQHVPRKLVVTPHPGEMARLLDTSIKEVQSDRFGHAQVASKEWNVVVVLKGSNTIVADPSGGLCVNSTGGSNLGTGGTGDVLTGVIAGLLAQGMSPIDASTAGVFIHGAAGDRLRTKYGDAGTLASDLWSVIPQIRMEIEKQERLPLGGNG